MNSFFFFILFFPFFVVELKMFKNLFTFCAFAALALVASSNFFGGMPNLKDLKQDEYGIIYMGTRPTYDQKQFIGKKVFITGGSSGMGFATAMTFARFGADVVIISRDSNASWFNGLLNQ